MGTRARVTDKVVGAELESCRGAGLYALSDRAGDGADVRDSDFEHGSTLSDHWPKALTELGGSRLLRQAEEAEWTITLTRQETSGAGNVLCTD